MVNHQETAYSAVVVNDYYVSLSLPISCFYGRFWVKNDRDGIHKIIHYNCTIGGFLFHLLLMIYHPYPLHFMQ